MDPGIDNFQTIEKLMATDLEHWLCNFYFEIIKLPRYLLYNFLFRRYLGSQLFRLFLLDAFKEGVIHQSGIFIFREKSVFFSFQSPKPTNQISPISRVF